MSSRQFRISRRAWLLSLSGLSLLRGDEPKNISFPLQAIEGTLTPPDLFFVRDHFTEPDVSLSAWKLKIEGRVARPLEMTFADILESPTKKLEAVLECAGNVASGFAVSNGVWEGVPMVHLLEQAKPAPEASSVLLEGSDTGRLLRDAPDLPYSQLVPLQKCLQPESLVTFRVNDRFLPRRNGFPARALLPGWYGMDSVKWLRRIVVLRPGDKPGSFHESGLDELYNRLMKTPGGRRGAARVSQILVKSSIAYPLDGARLPAATHMVWGFAWTGGGTIRSVEFSADGGSSWSPAKLESAPKPLAWVRWSCRWAATPGEHALLSRATDQAGHQQPLVRDPSREDGYELNWCAPLRCSVK
ncbi:MAG TPA: molybdopterin-dependent oxidoreductase [Bryobacterales bacterium]|nr:molybdopterin-dependent oxidoreductase [Bryobacterales bacterium]